VLTNDPSARQRGQVGDPAIRIVPPRRLDEDSTLQRNRVLPDLTGLKRPGVGRRSRVGMRHSRIVCHADGV
jgi:hypothetical protein